MEVDNNHNNDDDNYDYNNDNDNDNSNDDDEYWKTKKKQIEKNEAKEVKLREISVIYWSFKAIINY